VVPNHHSSFAVRLGSVSARTIAAVRIRKRDPRRGRGKLEATKETITRQDPARGVDWCRFMYTLSGD
jgi:hypothetical protein